MKTLYILLLTLVSHLALAQTTFVTRWNLAIAGSGDTQLTFGVETSGTVSYTWQEVSPGTASGSGTFTGSTATITSLPLGAVIDLSISPTSFNRFNINNGTDKNRLTDVKQWGTTAWTSMIGAFWGCSNLQISAVDLPNLGGVTSMSTMFAGCTILNGPVNIGSWNTSNVRDMGNMFYGAQAFNQPVGTWNTAKVTLMSYMFNGAKAFNQPILTQPNGIWNTSNVVAMAAMFAGADAFNQFIGNWDTGKVLYMGLMFSYAKAFNQPIGTWNTSQVIDMSYMFYSAISFNQSLGTWALNASVNLGDFLTSSALDCYHYSATLHGWSSNSVTPSGRALGAGGRQYGTNAVASRTNLTVTKGWTISSDAASGQDCSVALPVTLVSFSGKSTLENQNALRWITADEMDFDRFEIQRSSDAKRFETIGAVLGQSDKVEVANQILRAYTFTDKDPEVSNYYRLKMIDHDGTFEYSRIISIENSPEQAVVGSFYPNPSSGKVFVDVYAVESGSWTLTITDAGGRIIGTQVHDLQKGMNKIGLNRLSPGLNLVRFEHGLFAEVRKLIRE